MQVWARSTPSVASGLLPIGAWALYLTGGLSAGADAGRRLHARRGPLVRVDHRVTGLAVPVGAGVDAADGGDDRRWPRTRRRCPEWTSSRAPRPRRRAAAPAPAAPPGAGRLRRACTPTARSAVRDVDLTVERGQLVLVVGPVGSGKSSLLRALAGIVHHVGELRWNGDPVTEPEMFLRPNQVGYVGQLPRVLSGTVADNIALGHQVDAAGAVSTAQLEHDLAAAGGGLGLLIGHKGTRLSGGQLQRLALARALAPRTELLVADDVSSALDVTHRAGAVARRCASTGSPWSARPSKRAALVRADHVVVLIDGTVADQGTWTDLEPRWGHLAG